MLRYLRYLILLAIAFALLVLAMANRAPVSVQLLPDDIAVLIGWQWQRELPLFAVIFGGVALGLLVGFVWEWLREHRHRSEAASKTAEARRLQRELAQMQDAKGVVQDDVLALLQKKP